MASKGWLGDELRRRGVGRRDLLQFCAGVATYFALPKGAEAELAQGIVKTPKPSLVWLEFQDCTGNTESLLRSSRPTVAEVILDTISLDYHDTVMAAAGAQAEAVLDQTMKDKSGKYLVVIEGSIPVGANGAYCTIGGKSALQIAREAAEHAAGVVAVGTCAAFGGIPAAAPNPTGALSVGDAVPGIKNLVNLPACPTNAENITALIVYYLTYKSFPPLDSLKRPLFAHGKTIHDNCERRAHFDAGQYVEAWGDEAHRNGECLYKMGCKGPETYNNCPVVRYNEGTNWPIGCGHPCVGCAEPNFWDRMTPFYRHLKHVPGFGIAGDVDKIGVTAVAAVGTAFAGHGLIQLGLHRRDHKEAPKEPEAKEPKP